MRAMREENVDICKKCNQLWPTHKMGPKGCTECYKDMPYKKRKIQETKDTKVGLTM